MPCRPWLPLIVLFMLAASCAESQPETAVPVVVVQELEADSFASDPDSRQLSSSAEPSEPTAATVAERREPASLIRIYTYLGHSVPGQENVTFVLSSAGDVLQINNGNVFAEAKDYQTWNVGAGGFRQIEDLLWELELIDSTVPNVEGNPGPAGAIAIDGRYVFGAHGLDLREGLTAEQQEVRSSFNQLISALKDMSWLDADSTRQGAWVPDRLTVTASEAEGSGGGAHPWPFETSIASMTSESRDGRDVLCLDGSDAQRAWELLMGSGENNSQVLVRDDGRLYRVGVMISYPGYQLVSDPCPGATNFGNPSSSPGPVEPASEYAGLFDPLFLDDREFPGWKTSSIIPVTGPPNVWACPGGNGPGEQATSEFDGWLQVKRTVDSSAFSVFQMAGWVDRPADTDAILAEMASFDDCDEPFKDQGLTQFRSGTLDRVPKNVAGAIYWSWERGSSYTVVADLVLANDVAIVLSLESLVPVQPEDLIPLIEYVVARMPLFDQHVEDCTLAAASHVEGSPAGYLAGCAGIADFLDIEQTWPDQ